MRECDYVAEIINFLNRAGIFSIQQFKEMLKKLEMRANQLQGRAEGGEKPSASLSMAVRETAVDSPIVLATKPGLKENPSISKPEQQNIPIINDVRIPDVQKKNDTSAPEQTSKKEISLFYLLQHYNKENADIYRAQKEAKKQKGDKSSGKNIKEKAPGSSMGFAVPGQQKTSTAPLQQAVKFDDADSLNPLASSTPVSDPASAAKSITPPTSVSVIKRLSEESFGETEYFVQDDDGGTILLGVGHEEQRIQPYLIRVKNNEKIPLNGAVLRIGRSREFADYAIPENKFIGHSHCHILARNGEYYIVDDNSKNHTYVNGDIIQSNVEVKLFHSAIVTVANEEFEFRLF